MRLRQLQQFVTLAETGNFRRAAERLHMAQPPLSVSIRKLEQELGSALFERTGSGALLTPAGQAMLADARLVLRHAERCRQAVQDLSAGEGGTIRLGFVGSATYALLPRLIPALRERHPGITLELSEGTSAGILDGLVARRLDAGLVRYPMPEPSGFELLTLDRDEFVLAVHADSALARRRSMALSEAADQTFIMYSQTRVPGLRMLAMQRCQASGFVPQVAQEANQVQTVLSLVASGLGVALVAGVARRVMPPGVSCLSLSDNPPGFHIGLALVRLADTDSLLLQRLAEQALRCADAPARARQAAPSVRR